MNPNLRESEPRIQRSTNAATPLITPPSWELHSGNYRVFFAKSSTQMQSAQRLRFKVFNEELGQGLKASYETGRDEDSHDLYCHHLIVEHVDTAQAVGTYRMSTRELCAPLGFYSLSEFDLSQLPSWIMDEGVEIGRACVHE
ncbi:MAG: GNAT family N-acetyltransferase, partial [Polyangiales bacterium]